LFLLGGANSLRGYNWFDVGRKRQSPKLLACYQSATPAAGCPNKTGPYPDAVERSYVPYGGTQQFFYNAELEFPLISEAGIKGVVFYDIGNADDIILLEDLRQDVGFGFRWFSPIGPLRFEWGFPIQRRAGDPAVNFQFAIGSPF
jgi:outer membrane protein insertion porin family